METRQSIANYTICPACHLYKLHATHAIAKFGHGQAQLHMDHLFLFFLYSSLLITCELILKLCIMHVLVSVAHFHSLLQCTVVDMNTLYCYQMQYSCHHFDKDWSHTGFCTGQYHSPQNHHCTLDCKSIIIQQLSQI